MHESISRRHLVAGAGVAAAVAATLPLTAAAGGPSGAPAWGIGFPQAISPASGGLTYLSIDGFEFQALSGSRYFDELTGAGHLNGAGKLVASLPLPSGSVVRQINVGYLSPTGTTMGIQIFERDFTSASNVPWSTVGFRTVPGGSGSQSMTVELPTPVTLRHGCSYSVHVLLPAAGASVRGVTLGYLPPAAGFVPFEGAQPRIVDSRSGATLASGQELVVDLGRPGVRGALLNVTVTQTENPGFVSAFADGIAWPGNSSVNYAHGQTVANGVVTAVSAAGRIKLRCGGPGSRTHVIVDRLGWFI